MVSQDANFKLKSRMRPSKQEDVWMGPGLAYFVDPSAYAEYVGKFVNDEDVRAPLSAARTSLIRLADTSLLWFRGFAERARTKLQRTVHHRRHRR